MQFAVKRRLLPTLVTLAVVLGLALAARTAWHLEWRLSPYPTLPAHVLVALGAMLACDGAVYALLCRAFGDRYHACQRTLAAYFAPQGPPEMIAGGMLAAGEELLFRGVILESLITHVGMNPAAAVGVSALLFGALHVLRDPRLAPFALWAVGQGVILGSLYLASRSLLLVVLVHAGHDTLGFVLLAYQRHTERERHGGCQR